MLGSGSGLLKIINKHFIKEISYFLLKKKEGSKIIKRLKKVVCVNQKYGTWGQFGALSSILGLKIV